MTAHISDWLWLAVIWTALVLAGRWSWPRSGGDPPIIEAQERIAEAEARLYRDDEKGGPPCHGDE